MIFDCERIFYTPTTFILIKAKQKINFYKLKYFDGYGSCFSMFLHLSTFSIPICVQEVRMLLPNLKPEQ